MENTNNILTGLVVAGQVPLDAKTYVIDEATLMDLGTSDNLAYTYHKGLKVTCITERTIWEWKEYEIGDITLIPDNFIYPNGLIVNGIDYSNKEYNFAQIVNDIPEPQNLQETLDVGDSAIKGNASYEMSTDGFETITSENSFGFIQTSVLRTPASLAQLTNYYSENGGSNNIQGGFHIDAGKAYIRQNIDGFTSGKTTIVQFQDPTNNTIILFPAKNSNGTYTLVTEDQIPTVDGSETIIVDSSTITKVGNGTLFDPYQLNLVQNSNQKIITYPGSFTGSNYNLVPDDNNKLFIVNNGITDVTITTSVGLPDEFFAAFIRKGVGEVTIVESSVTINSASGKRINRQFDQVALDKEGSTNIFYLTGNTKV